MVSFEDGLELRSYLTVIALSFLFLALLLIGFLFVWLRKRSLKRKNLELMERQNLEDRLQSLDTAETKEEVERD